MIENIKQELANVLGGDFKVYYNTSNSVIESEAEEDKGIGVFMVTAGDIRPLQGNQGLEASCLLRLFVPVFPLDLYHKLLAKIDDLVDNTNGTIISIDETKYSYVISYKVPRPSSNVTTLAGTDRQIYDVSLNIVLSSVCLFGNGAVFKVDNEILEGIFSWNILSENPLTSNLFTNSYIGFFIPQFNTYKLSLTLMLQDSSLHKRLQSIANAQTRVIFSVGQTINGVNKVFRGIMERFTLTGTKGGFQVADIIFAEVQP